MLLTGFIFTPRAVQGYHLTARIGGCGVGDFSVLGTINLDVVDGDFHQFLQIWKLESLDWRGKSAPFFLTKLVKNVIIFLSLGGN